MKKNPLKTSSSFDLCLFAQNYLLINIKIYVCCSKGPALGKTKVFSYLKIYYFFTILWLKSVLLKIGNFDRNNSFKQYFQPF